MTQGREPNIILWDLETLPDLDEVMKIFPQLGAYPGLTLKATVNSIICFGYKIYGQGEAKSINAWDFPQWELKINDDYFVVQKAYEILKDADAIVTHNGKKFDWKFLQTRLLKHGFPPLPKIPHIDTCSEAKKNLYLFNNRLNTLAKFFTDKEKLENGGWDLWVKVRDRDADAMKLMAEYCIQDVLVLEDVFNKLKPFMHLPNHNLYVVGERPVCPNCGSTRLHGHGYHQTKTNTYHRYLCQDCGSTCRTDAANRLPRRI